LNNGQKPRWPKGANAIRAVSVTGKATQMKGEEEAFRGTNILTAEFGKVPFDRKGRPEKTKFQPIQSAATATTKRG
jgi:hypothetical protein